VVSGDDWAGDPLVSFKITAHTNAHLFILGQAVKVLGCCVFVSFRECINYQRRIFDSASHDARMAEPTDHLARILLALKDALG